MPIAREGKFLVTRTFGQTAHLGIESEIIGDCIEEIIAKGYRGVFGSSVFGFRESTLDALRLVPCLESVWFWDIHLKDVEAIYTLRSLQFFGVQPKRPAIDFEKLPSLKRLVLTPRPKDRGVEHLRLLENLDLWHYTPKSKSFAAIQLPAQLAELQINWANPKTLEGLNGLTSLRRLEICRCRNLESLALIPALFPNLEYLVVHACGRISSAENAHIAKELPKLTHAYIQDTKFV